VRSPATPSPNWLHGLRIAGAAALAIAAFLAISAVGDVVAPTSPAGSGGPGPGTGSGVAGVGCDLGGRIAYHVHAHLAIRIGGVDEPVPADIGLTTACRAWIHTHVAGGIIHVEAPRPLDATLGMFFALWGRALAPDRIGDRVAQPGERVYAFLDSTPWTGALGSIPLRGGAVIELQIGQAPLAPLPYRFPSDLR